MTVLLAGFAALVYGLAVAAQHHEAAAIDPSKSLRPRLLLGLVVRPLWLLGLVGDVGGFALQTAALAAGSLIVVQPILTSSLLVSLLVGARMDRRPLRRWEWSAVVGTMAGLAVFLVAARPTAHSDAVTSARTWVLAVGLVALLAAVALFVGRSLAGARRGMCFALAAACAEAVMAVLAKAFGDRLGKGVWSTFGSWQPYAVVACGVLTLVLVQSAYQVGDATATLPVLTVTE
ncbi:MAG: DMT family transporter, partial [Actinomycetota bacterium]